MLNLLIFLFQAKNLQIVSQFTFPLQQLAQPIPRHHDSNVPRTLSQLQKVFSALKKYGNRHKAFPRLWADLENNGLLKHGDLLNQDAILENDKIHNGEITLTMGWYLSDTKLKPFSTARKNRTVWSVASYYTGPEGESSFLSSAPRSLNYKPRNTVHKRGPWIVLWSTGEIEAVPYERAVLYDLPEGENGRIGFIGDIYVPKDSPHLEDRM